MEVKNLISLLKNDILQDGDIEISENTNLLNSGIIDSMTLLRFISAIEDKIQSKIPPTDLVIENFTDINAISTYLNKSNI